MLLAATDDIAGTTTTAAAVDATITVQESSTALGLVWKVGYEAQLPTGAAADLYSVPASTEAIIDEITLHNTNAAAQLVVLSVRKGAGTLRIWARFTLEQNQSAHYLRGQGWTVFDGDGLVKLATQNRSGTSFPVTPFDGQPFYRTDLNHDFNWFAGIGEWLGEMEQLQYGRNGVVAAGNLLRMGGNLIGVDAEKGFTFPYDVTVVGMAVCKNLTESGDWELLVNGSAVAVLVHSLVEWAKDMTLSANVAATSSKSTVANIRWGGTPAPVSCADVSAQVWYRRRAS